MNAIATRKYPNLFDSFFEDIFKVAESRGTHTPGIEVQKNEREYVVVAHLPGVKKEDLTVSVENGVLKILGKYEQHQKKENETVYSELHSLTEFSRALRVDQNRFNVENVEAKLENGILTVKLPIREEVKPKQITVNVG